MSGAGGTRYRLGWHDSGPGSATLVTGAYPVRGEIGRRLLDTLSDVQRVASGYSRRRTDLLAAAVSVDAPDRLAWPRGLSSP